MGQHPAYSIQEGPCSGLEVHAETMVLTNDVSVGIVPAPLLALGGSGCRSFHVIGRVGACRLRYRSKEAVC